MEPIRFNPKLDLQNSKLNPNTTWQEEEPLFTFKENSPTVRENKENKDKQTAIGSLQEIFEKIMEIWEKKMKIDKKLQDIENKLQKERTDTTSNNKPKELKKTVI